MQQFISKNSLCQLHLFQLKINLKVCLKNDLFSLSLFFYKNEQNNHILIVKFIEVTMSLNRKENSRKIKTEVSSSQSLPKFRIQTSKTVFYQQKINEIVS